MLLILRNARRTEPNLRTSPIVPVAYDGLFEVVRELGSAASVVTEDGDTLLGAEGEEGAGGDECF